MELFGAQVLRDVDEVTLGRVPVVPEYLTVWLVMEAFELAHRFGDHFGLVLLADDPVVSLVLLEERGSELVESEAAAAHPIGTRGDTSRIVSFDDFLESRQAASRRVVSEFDPNPAAPELVRNSSSRARTEE